MPRHIRLYSLRAWAAEGRQMQAIAAADYKAMPWANGRGVTHEIAREDREASLLWRLSLAEVPEDGPFSLFPGLARILTVIEGEGLRLEGEKVGLAALPFRPVAFPGGVPVSAKLLGGKVRDLNLIYDPSRLAARGACCEGPADLTGAGRVTALWLASGRVGPLAPGDTALLQPGESLRLPQGARGIALELDPIA